jgi:hypothetical protein
MVTTAAVVIVEVDIMAVAQARNFVPSLMKAKVNEIH